MALEPFSGLWADQALLMPCLPGPALPAASLVRQVWPIGGQQPTAWGSSCLCCVVPVCRAVCVLPVSSHFLGMFIGYLPCTCPAEGPVDISSQGMTAQVQTVG